MKKKIQSFDFKNFSGGINREDMFRKRNTDLKFWLAVISIMILLGIVGHMEGEELKLKQQILQCQAQRQKAVHLWTMTESCSEQLLNSQDGILRIKVSQPIPTLKPTPTK